MVNGETKKSKKGLAVVLIGGAVLLGIGLAVSAKKLEPTCPDGEILLNGECFNPDIFNFCSQDNPCPQGSICSGGICVPFHLVPLRCPDDFQCFLNQNCVNGQCVDIPNFCLVNGDCGVNQRCVNLRCEDIPECEFIEFPERIFANDLQKVVVQYNNLFEENVPLRAVSLKVSGGNLVISTATIRLNVDVNPSPGAFRVTFDKILLNTNLQNGLNVLGDLRINDLTLELTFYHRYRAFGDPADVLACSQIIRIPIERGAINTNLRIGNIGYQGGCTSVNFDGRVIDDPNKKSLVAFVFNQGNVCVNARITMLRNGNITEDIYWNNLVCPGTEIGGIDGVRANCEFLVGDRWQIFVHERQNADDEWLLSDYLEGTISE